MKLAYKLFGKKYRARRAEYSDFERTLRAARINKTYDQYLAEVEFYSLISAAAGVALSFVIYHFVGGILTRMAFNLRQTYRPVLPNLPIHLPLHLPHVHLHLHLPTIHFSVGSFLPYLLLIILIALVSTLMYYLVKSLLLLYPSIKVDERKRNINRLLPYATNYMYALSKGGVEILDIIRSLANRKDVYGDVAVEFKTIVRMIDDLGYDLHTAMLELYEVTPSDVLREFINGLLTTLDCGGDVTLYFAQKCEQYTENVKKEQRNLIEMLGLLAESYVSIAVAAPLFIIIIQSTMLAVGGGNVNSMYSVIYVLIPLSTLFFISIIYLLTPKDKIELEKRKKRKEEKKDEEFKYDDFKLYKKLKKEEAKKERMKYLKSPLQIMKENPYYSLVISIPIAIAYVLSTIRVTRPDFVIVSGALIALTPLTIFYEARKRRVNRIKSQIPSFLKNMAEIVSTGATIKQAIEVASESGHGGIYEELKKVSKSLNWGVEITEALEELAERIRLPVFTRFIAVLIDVLRIGGDLTEALNLCNKEAVLDRRLAEERKFAMMIYTIIIYVAFLTFLGVMVMLMTHLFPVFFKSIKSGKSLMFGGAKVSKNQVTWVLSQAMIVQAIFSGMVAGVIGEGELIAGTKHVILMLLFVLGVILYL